jgi:alkylglycerol monooxygenase
MDLIALSIPLFFLLIGIEVLVSRLGGRRWYRTNDSIADLGCGVANQVTEVAWKALIAFPYVWIWENARILDLSPWPVALWFVAIVGKDFGYYWWHRASHRINFVWATHVVHHQSEEYNLTVALRQSIFAGLTSWPFYLWLAFFVSPEAFVTSSAINLIYQFWIHTRAVDRLGPIEWIFNTPSHHRVHHGVNRAYLDKNYGGIFIVFDRMFGTFQPEGDDVIYGTVTPFRSWDPLYANFEPFAKLWDLSRRAPRWQDKIWAWFAPPEWWPEGLDRRPWPTDSELAARPRYDLDAPALHAYVLVQWVPMAVGTVAMLLLEKSAPVGFLAILGAWILLSLVSFAALFERRAWAHTLEHARLGLGAGLVAMVLVARGEVLWASLPLALALGSSQWLRAGEKRLAVA